MDFLKDPDVPTRNRGFAFVVYKDHPSADKARRNLSRPSFHIGKSFLKHGATSQHSCTPKCVDLLKIQ